MSFKNWADSRVKKLSWVDIKMVKWSTFAFALMLAKLWKPLLALDWYWYLLIAVLAAIKPTYMAFRKEVSTE